jgi:hypothetical protein
MGKELVHKWVCLVGKGFQAMDFLKNVQVAFLPVVGVANAGRGKTVKTEKCVITSHAKNYSLSMELQEHKLGVQEVGDTQKMDSVKSVHPESRVAGVVKSVAIGEIVGMVNFAKTSNVNLYWGMGKEPVRKWVCPVGKGIQAMDFLKNVQVAFLPAVTVKNVGLRQTVKTEKVVVIGVVKRRSKNVGYHLFVGIMA